MSVLVTILGGVRRQMIFGVGIALAVLAAVFAVWRHGRAAGIARFLVKRADARVRAMEASKGVRHDVGTSDRADLDDRADRWMRD